MGVTMSEGPNSLKVATFKPVPGGWIYRAPNPWVFGDVPHYFVNEAQKAQIEALIVPRWPVLSVVLLLGGIFGWVIAVTTFLWAFSGHENPTTGDLAIMIALIGIPMLAILPVAGLIQTHRLAPILATARLTTERISYAEISQNIRRSTPLKQSLNACIASVFACCSASVTALLHLSARHFVFDAYVALWGFVAITFGSVSVVWYRRALRKANELEACGSSSPSSS
jgi:hypothetical protein